MNNENNVINEATISHWLVEKFAYKKSVEPAEIDVNQLFIDFGIDSTEVLVLAGELEDWIEIELPPTAMWYHPTIAKLSAFIAEELESATAE